MEKSLHTLPVTVALVLLGSIGYADTMFLGGDIGVSSNWSSGLPTSVGNPGSIATNGTISADATLTNFYMTQTAGTIASTGIGHPYRFSGGTFTQNGGTWGSSGNRALTIRDGNITTLNSGSIIGGNKDNTIIEGGSSMIINGGTFEQYGNRSVLLDGDSTLTINGGTFTVVGSLGTGRLDGGNDNEININGGTILVGKLRFGDGGNQVTINLGGSTAGSLTAADYAAAGDDQENVNARLVNWLSGSLITMTLTNAAADWAETEWSAGRLTYNGQDYTTLGTWATVTSTGFGDGSRFNFDAGSGTLSLVSGAVDSFAITLDGLDSTVSFLTDSNYWYTLEFSTVLTNGFSPVTNFPGDGFTNTIAVDTSTANGFFRAKKSSTP